MVEPLFVFWREYEPSQGMAMGRLSHITFLELPKATTHLGDIASYEPGHQVRELHSFQLHSLSKILRDLRSARTSTRHDLATNTPLLCVPYVQIHSPSQQVAFFGAMNLWLFLDPPLDPCACESNLIHWWHIKKSHPISSWQVGWISWQQAVLTASCP